ncbi:MAG TPA: 4a-hydroxytetrahydrobiopterin dehydratase [Pyrinomonadaceae bacterium]
MKNLLELECAPCRGGTPPLRGDDLRELLAELDGWEVVDEHHLRKVYQFKNFREAFAFVGRVSEVSEAQGHHPDICFGWGRAEITIWTHKIGGLSDNDFILAAKIDAL